MFHFEKTHNTSLEVDSINLWKRLNLIKNGHFSTTKWFLEWIKMSNFGKNGLFRKKLITRLLKLTQFRCERGQFWSKMAIFRPKLFLEIIQMDNLVKNGLFRKKFITLLLKLSQFRCDRGHLRTKMAIFRQRKIPWIYSNG